MARSDKTDIFKNTLREEKAEGADDESVERTSTLFQLMSPLLQDGTLSKFSFEKGLGKWHFDEEEMVGCKFDDFLEYSLWCIFKVWPKWGKCKMQEHEAAVDKDANLQRGRRRKRFLSNLVATLFLFFFASFFLFFFCQFFVFSSFASFLSFPLLPVFCLFFFCHFFSFSSFASFFEVTLLQYCIFLPQPNCCCCCSDDRGFTYLFLPLSWRAHFQSNAPKLSKEWSSIRNICQPADFKEQEQSWCCCIATELLNEVPPNFLAISPPTLCQCHQVTPSSRHQHTSTLMSVMFWANLPFTTLSPTRCSIWLCVSTMIAAS